MKTDSLFYRLFQNDPGLALDLAGVAVPEPERYRFGSQEVKQTAFRLDGVLEPPADQPGAPLAFIEVQFQPDDGFYLRFFSEILLYLRQYQPAHDWVAVVLYPSAAAEAGNRLAAPLLGLPNLRRIYLDRLPLLDSANPKHWLVALIVAEEKQIPAIVRKVQAHRLNQPADGVDWLDWLETVLVYKLPQITREEILAMFGFNDIGLKETRFYQQVFSEGRVEGRVEGEAAVVLRLIERRFGPPNEATRQRVASADAETLLLWAERLLDAKTLEEVWGH